MLHSPDHKSASTAAALAPEPRASTRPGVTDIVLISPHKFDKNMLESAISSARWNVFHVHGCEEALAIMTSVLVPVVVCDRGVQEGRWQEAMHRIFSSPHPAPVLLTAASYDWRLWVETIDCGGFDLLVSPFRNAEEKLLRARRHWEDGRVRRTWDQFFRR
jgi:DNA-binding NtrC family response regulator